jgi:hypothetical protein
MLPDIIIDTPGAPHLPCIGTRQSNTLHALANVPVSVSVSEEEEAGLGNDGLVGLENDGLVGLRNNDLDCDGLAMVVDDDKEMTAPGPRWANNPRDDVAMPPLLPRQKSSPRTVCEGIDLAAMMQSSSPAGLRVIITNGSSSMTTRRSSPLSHPGGTDGSSPSSSLLVLSGADSVTAAAFAATFAAKCNDKGDNNDDNIGFVIVESSSTIDLDAHLTHEEVMFGVPEVNDFGAIESVVFDDVENGTTKTSSYHTPIESHDDAKTEEEDDVDEATIGLECGGLVSFECDNLVGDVLVSDLSDSEEMGGMPSLPEPDPIRYFLMDHPLYPELQRLGIRNSMSFVPFATRAKSLEEVEVVIVQHFPPTNDDILYQGIFHSNKDDRMPAERSWSRVLKCAVKALRRHGLDEASATKLLMDKTMGANLIPFDNVCTWYSNKDTRPSYDAFAKEAHPLMTEIFKDIFQACPNIKAVVIHGEEPHKVIVKNGGFIPLELIVNKTHNVAHGCRLSNNAYHSCEWIIYTDVVVETVAILLDQDAIPLVTTEDRSEILLEPTWNSTEGKAARKQKRKNGMTAIEKAADEAQRMTKAAKRDQKRAEKEAVDKAQRVTKAAERDRKRAEKEAADEAQRVMKAAERDQKRAEKEAVDKAQRVTKAAKRDQKRAEKEAVDEAQRVTKAAERDRKRAEKEAADEAQRVAKAAERDRKRAEKWTAEVDASILSMLKGGVSFSKMASKLGNGLTENDIRSRWHTKLKKSSGIIKPAVQTGFPSRFTWTAEDDATIVRMRTDGESFPKIASELGNDLASHDIMNRWNRHLR